MSGTVAHYAIFVTAAVVISELVLVGGVSVAVVVLRRRRRKRAKWAAIAEDVSDVEARRTQSRGTPDRPTVERLQARRDQETDDPASHPDTSRNGNEATVQLPRVPWQDAESTMPPLLVRRYMHAAEPHRTSEEIQ